MPDAEDARPQDEKPRGESVASPDEGEEDEEEAGWPSWLSWGLVIVAAVFGGYMLGYSGKGGGGAGDPGAQLELRRQIAMIDQEKKAMQERAERRIDHITKMICREMIYTGLFRDGLDEKLKALKGDIVKTLDQLGKGEGKPEDRLAKATGQLKEIEKGVDEIDRHYALQSKAVEKVGNLGLAEEAVEDMKKQLVYLYWARLGEVMAQVRAGDKSKASEAKMVAVRLMSFDPNYTEPVGKAFPELVQGASAPQTPGAQPKTGKAPAPRTQPKPGKGP
ncbi:MAG: hypothetical protein JXQ73_28390 [Phycisphaerae bacterium]|nr:hypothetical protein [Phycisphaerae bacterium]